MSEIDKRFYTISINGEEHTFTNVEKIKENKYIANSVGEHGEVGKYYSTLYQSEIDRAKIYDAFPVKHTAENTKSVISDYELDDATSLAFDLDRFFRAHDKNYSYQFSDIQEKQQELADCLLLGRYVGIRKLLDDMGKDGNDVLPAELAEYEKNYPKNLYLIYQLKQDDSAKNLRFSDLERIRQTGNDVRINNYELVYLSQLTPADTLESLYAEFNLHHPSDFRGHSLSVSDIVVFRENGNEKAYYCDSVGFKEVPEFLDFVPTISACRSRFENYTAFVGADEKVYLGKTDKYIFASSMGGQSYYNNDDKSLIHISDNKNMYSFLYSEGWVASQQTMLDNGAFKQSDYAEYERIRTGVLSGFENIKLWDIAFDGKPFNYLETAEKTEEQNFNQIDGQINNEDSGKDSNMENTEKDTITVLVVEPMKTPYVKDIESGLKSLQKEVDGNIEACYPFADKVGIVCNEEGKINGLPLNRAIYDDDKTMIEIMAGTFLICGLDNENSSFGSLDADMIKSIRICSSTRSSFSVTTIKLLLFV